MAAAGGVAEEIFLEVTGKQALWHTPSWRALRSNAGGGCAARGEGRTCGWRGAMTVPGDEGTLGTMNLGKKGVQFSVPGITLPPKARNTLKLHTAPTPTF